MQRNRRQAIDERTKNTDEYPKNRVAVEANSGESKSTKSIPATSFRGINVPIFNALFLLHLSLSPFFLTLEHEREDKRQPYIGSCFCWG